MNRRLTAWWIITVVFAAAGCGEKIGETPPVTAEQQNAAEDLVGLGFDSAERELMRDDLAEQRASYAALRAISPDNAVAPAIRFDPLTPWGGRIPTAWRTAYLPDIEASTRPAGPVSRPDDLGDLAFADITELSALVRTRQVTCLELTELALDRLEEHGPRLECVITRLDTRARARARELDAMLARGEYLGPLHGIPYGGKDLLAVTGAPTTWGATPYRNQVLDDTATVVRKLDAAGAVLVAKLTLGALAWGDVWFGGTTRNPWNLEQGSSGSSAGSAAAVAAGLVPFAIGSETWGSIVSPATRCGVTGLRPTFGRVSRAGAMALSWSMDKIGPLARTTEDCALVFDAIRGADPRDPTTIDLPFPYRHDLDLAQVRIGYLASAFEADDEDRALDLAVLDVLRDAGADLIPVELPESANGLDPYDLSFILSVEAAAAFQDLTLSGRDDELVRQVRYAWPNVFRAAHLVPAVEYIQANRHRTILMHAMAELFEEVDVYVTPTFAGQGLLITNLTGHPQVVVPNGLVDGNVPHTVGFVGRLYDEATVLAVAGAYQRATGWHRKNPPGF